MILPALHPDFTFPQLETDRESVDFAFDAKKAAMGPYIAQRWGWDEAVQRQIHQSRVREKPFFEIRKAGDRLGTLSFQTLTEHVRFGEFYLFPQYQGKGIGSAVLSHCLSLADSMRLPVRLEHLLWNPIGSLYRRHGFVEVSRSENHCFMERPHVPADAKREP